MVTGRIVQRGENLSITVELVDASDNHHLWGEQYNRNLSEILGVQADISKEISRKLRPGLTGEEKTRLAKLSTENTEAYELYLKGQYYWNRRTAQTLRRAADYFQQAVDRAPGFALAWAGLADSYALYSFYSAGAPREAVPRAKEAAMLALRIDDEIALAHVALAWVKMDYDWDWSGAEREFKRALELSPNDGTVHHRYGSSLLTTGRLDDYLAETKRARELEPTSLIINSLVGRAFYYGRQYDPAINELRKTLDMDPNFVSALWYIGLAYEQKSMYPEAITAWQNAARLSGGDPVILGSLGHAYAASGRRSDALHTLAELKEMAKQRYVAPFDVAVVYVGLRDKDQTFKWLQKALEDHSHWVIWLKCDPRFDSIRSDPRYAQVMRYMGLPQWAVAHPEASKGEVREAALKFDAFLCTDAISSGDDSALVRCRLCFTNSNAGSQHARHQCLLAPCLRLALPLHSTWHVCICFGARGNFVPLAMSISILCSRSSSVCRASADPSRTFSRHRSNPAPSAVASVQSSFCISAESPCGQTNRN
ncbi:MAG TPA: tetratricopeptide repeat protein [Terriglobales bacterium]|nr:tetratricopeptide repeat protein [Terriglobales bacterium]